MKNKVVMCLCVAYIKILMSQHFEPNLVEIEQIELDLFKFKSGQIKKSPCTCSDQIFKILDFFFKNGSFCIFRIFFCEISHQVPLFFQNL